MSNAADRSPAAQRSPSHLIATLLLALGIFAGLWFASQALASSPPATPEGAATSEAAESWPTTPPTVTPRAAAGSLLMPTPIPLPRWEERRELIVGKLTIASIQKTQVEAGRNLSFNKMALLRLTYEVQVTVDLSQLGPGTVRREGNTVEVTLPTPTWKQPAWVGIASLEEEHHSVLFPNGPNAGVIAQGERDVIKQLEANPGLRRLIYNAARTQMSELLKDLGFRQVTVNIAGVTP